MAKYPFQVQIITGKGDPNRMFRPLAVFEQLQDGKLVGRVKTDIDKECKVKNQEKNRRIMCLVLGTGRTAWAQEMMKHMDEVFAADEAAKAKFDIEKFRLSA